MKVKAALVMRCFAVMALFMSTGCATTIPVDKPSALVPLGNREFADFQFRVAPPPSAYEVSGCRQLARPKGWFVIDPTFGVYVAAALRDAAEHARQGSVFKDCLTQRGYVVERVDAAPMQPPSSSDFGSRR